MHEPLLVIVAVAVVLGSRAVLARFIVSDSRARVMVFLAGIRWALPLALTLALPASLQDRPQIVDAVFATVLVTLVFQGIPLRVLVERLYGDKARRHEPTA